MKKLVLLMILILSSFTQSKAFVGWILEGEDQIVEASRYAEEKVWRGKMLTNAVSTLKNAKEMYDNAVSIKDFAESTRDLTDSVKQGIKSLYDFQYDIRQKVTTIKSLQHLKWTDVADIGTMALNVEVNPTKWDLEYFNIVENSPLIQYFGNPDDYDYDHTDINGLYSLFGPTLEDLVDKPIVVKQDELEENIQELEEDLTSGIENSMVMQQTYRKVLLDASFKYEKMSKDFAEKALEMAEVLQLDENVKLTHGEQFEMHYLMNQYLAQSVEFKVKAAEYRAEASKKTREELNMAVTNINTYKALNNALKQLD